jgi:hypothetical protein
VTKNVLPVNLHKQKEKEGIAAPVKALDRKEVEQALSQ